MAKIISEEITMIMDNPGQAFFEADPADEFRLTFSLLSPLHASGKKPLMTMRCFEEDKMRAAVVFLGERQHLWSEWSTIAEEEGGNYLGAIIMDLVYADSLKRFGCDHYLPERCLGAQISSMGESTIQLDMMLATRSLTIIKHAFTDKRTWEAFMENQVYGDRYEGTVELAELALLRGRAALAHRLDDIAATRVKTYSRTVH